MKRLFLVLLVLALTLTTLIAQAADNTVVGVVTNVEPGMIVVKTDAGQTTSVTTDAKTVYRKWILQKPWGQDPRADEHFVRVGKRVHIEVAKDNPSTAGNGALHHYPTARTLWIVVGRVGFD